MVSPWSRWTWFNLLVAVLLGVIHFGVVSTNIIVNAGELSAYWSPYAGRVLLAPFAVTAMLIFLGLAFYRFRRPGSRIWALMTGLYFGALCLIRWVNADLMDQGLQWPQLGFLFYLAGSHLLFAFLGRERG